MRLGAAPISPPPLAATSSIEQEHAVSLCATALSARDALQDIGNVSARSTSTSSRSPTQCNCVFVGGSSGKSREIAALQHFAACWSVGERLRRPTCSWAARRCTVCSAHSAPSQLSTSMRTTASRCTTEALKAVLEVLWMLSMVPPSMLAEIDKCLRVARWTSLDQQLKSIANNRDHVVPVRLEGRGALGSSRFEQR
jgi:hypothetical protein